jgi:hypothetical protein
MGIEPARGEYVAPWRQDKIELLESLATSCQKKQIRSMSRERQIDQLFLLETLSCCLADLMGHVSLTDQGNPRSTQVPRARDR